MRLPWAAKRDLRDATGRRVISNHLPRKFANYDNLNHYISTKREARLTTSAATGWPGELRCTRWHPLPLTQHAYNCRSLNFNSHPQTPIHHPSASLWSATPPHERPKPMGPTECRAPASAAERTQIKRASLKSAEVDGLFHGPSFKCVLWRGLTTCPAKVKHRGMWKSIEKGTISPSTAHPERPRHSTYNHRTVNVDCSEEITVQLPKYRIISTSQPLVCCLTITLSLDLFGQAVA